MSTLDEAFLKAYRKGQRPAEQPAGGGRRVAPLAYDTRIEVGPPGASVPSPHARFAHEQPPPTQAAAAVAPPVVSNPDPEPVEIRPAFEVTGFLWPPLAEEFINTAGEELLAAADQLAERSHAGLRTLLVTGCARGEGRTSVVLGLGRALGRRGLRTVLVDADFLHPDLANQLGVAPQLSAADVYRGLQPVTEALVESVDESLTLLPLARAVLDLTAIAAAGGLATALDTLRHAFDLVLIDSGPLDSDRSALDLATALGPAAVDAALVVCDPSRSTRDHCRLVGRRLAAARVTQWDLVENFVGGHGVMIR